MSVNVLVADHEPTRREALSKELEADGYEVIRAASPSDALRSARALRPLAVILELGPDTALGLTALDELVDLEDAPSVVLVADGADVPTAVAAMRRGAESFLVRPLAHEALSDVLRRALTRRRAVPVPAPDASDTSGEPTVVARSPAMQRVLAQVERIAASADATVLIQGESGTGKELLARRIHSRSSRSKAPFVPIVCAALSSPRPGCEPSFGSFAGAKGGTLYFDEVGELPPALQAKLAGILQERNFSADGGLAARVVAATTRDLEASVAEGAFRADLFYRLNVLAIRVPPLRERVADLPDLAARFLASAEAALGRRFEGFTDRALESLASHTWPGNVRELENAIVRAATLESSRRIRPQHLGLSAQAAKRAAVDGPRSVEEVDPTDRTLRAMEKTHIARVLHESLGNRSRAARLLGVNRTTLYGKLRRHGLE